MKSTRIRMSIKRFKREFHLKPIIGYDILGWSGIWRVISRGRVFVTLELLRATNDYTVWK